MTRFSNNFDVNNFAPFAVGFDRMFNRLAEFPQPQASTGFPPYNIRRHRDEEKFAIELALAGLSEDDVDIEMKEQELIVRSTWDEQPQDDTVLLHKGISHKKFTRSFTLADDVEVVGANFKNGLLTIALERIIPKEKQPKKIKIDNKRDLLFT
ncbi:Hsp20 family protein [bacterium]|jgi:molecular chaperone IbpA|nr:Hsp20 family protein [bacterium]